MTEQDIVTLIKNDKWMMSVLGEAKKLNLPDWLIGSGFLRNKVWDYLHDIKRDIGNTSDIDLVYFDFVNQDKVKDDELSLKMKGICGLDWEIKNQAYMHTKHNRVEPYKNSEEALSEWVETATCVAVRFKDDELEIVAPYGIDDLVNLIIRPTPSYKQDLDTFYNRINNKKWLDKWNKLVVLED